ncbi:MAG: hypothetical protein Kow0067_13480 [Coriobacteriia bacterium]
MTRRLIALTCTALIVASLSAPATAVAAAWPDNAVKVVLDVERLSGGNRFATAVAIAAESYPGWTGVDRVIVSSGEDRAMADPMAAAGLCWAYDAPLLLVTRTGVPAPTRAALAGIVKNNPSVTVTIVGGPAAVSASCVRELRTIVGSGNTVEQPWTTGNRYNTAASIARRMEVVASADASLTLSSAVLVANGTDAAGYVDALALSAVSARIGAPIVFVERTSVPTPTAATIGRLKPGEVIVAGGTAVVSAAVYKALGADARWYGANRYATAVAIAKNARAKGWLEADWVGVAAAVPDALTGATYAGKGGAPLLYTEPSRLSELPARYLDSVEASVTGAAVFGGTSVVSEETAAQLGGKPAAPVIVDPPTGGYVAKYSKVTVRVGVNTSALQLYSGDALIIDTASGSYATVSLDRMTMPADGISLKAVASNPEPKTATTSRTFKRLSYPASTSIVIDKSDFRLYWVRADELVKTYPIAIGRASMETPEALWKILAKYKTDPAGVYGPRKMRLFRKSGDSWVYTAYGIHGTNEPWVIGTKASHGCIRLYNSDIMALYPQVPLGTVVQTRR